MLREVKLNQDNPIGRAMGPLQSKLTMQFCLTFQSFELKVDVPNRVWYGVMACLALFTLSKVAFSE